MDQPLTDKEIAEAWETQRKQHSYGKPKSFPVGSMPKMDDRQRDHLMELIGSSAKVLYPDPSSQIGEPREPGSHELPGVVNTEIHQLLSETQRRTETEEALLTRKESGDAGLADIDAQRRENFWSFQSQLNSHKQKTPSYDLSTRLLQIRPDGVVPNSRIDRHKNPITLEPW